VVARVRSFSREQFRKSLVAAEILTESGALVAKYRKPRKP
jgi:hypothetical protein